MMRKKKPGYARKYGESRVEQALLFVTEER
jgi:hypothetical protein